MKVQAALLFIASTVVIGYSKMPPAPIFVNTRKPQQICDHPLYCNGPLLKAVQLSGIFEDDKEYIDMPTRYPVSQVVDAFNQLPASPSVYAISKFVNDNFYPAGSDIEPAELEDWTDDPPFLRDVTDPVLRGYGMAIHNQWRTLARRRKPSFLGNGCVSSLLPVNNTFIVSGGKTSREYGYWDTYYITLGLLQSGLTKTARGVLQNLLDMVDAYGFVPTGGRVYFTDRSEPPLLALMVKGYYEATDDLDFVRYALPLLQREHEFWDTYRSIDVTYARPASYESRLPNKNYTLVTQRTTLDGPDLFSITHNNNTDDSNGVHLRPEHFRGDLKIAQKVFKNPNLFKRDMMGQMLVVRDNNGGTPLPPNNLFGITESASQPSVQLVDQRTSLNGPDLFSINHKREIKIPTNNPFTAFTKSQLLALSAMYVNSTIPVSLNSIMHQMETTIADFIQLTNDNAADGKSKHYRKLANNRRQMLTDLTYNADTGLFSDLNLHFGRPTGIWTINSLWPYWAFGDSISANSGQVAMGSVAGLHMRYMGGLPNTLYNTTLEWDYPNVQPPLQHMAINSVAGIRKCTGTKAPIMGLEVNMIQNLVDSAFCNWYTTGGSIAGVLDSYANNGSSSESMAGLSFGHYVLDSNGEITTTTNGENRGDYTWTNAIILQMLGKHSQYLKLPKCPGITLNLVPPPPPPPTSTHVKPSPTSSTSCRPGRKCKVCRCKVSRMVLLE